MQYFALKCTMYLSDKVYLIIEHMQKIEHTHQLFKTSIILNRPSLLNATYSEIIVKYIYKSF